MIKYNPETRNIEISELIMWDCHVRPIYEEVREFMDEENEVCEEDPHPLYEYKSIPADELTKEQIDEIMEGIAEKYEFESYADEYTPDIDDCIRKYLEDWCEDAFNN